MRAVVYLTSMELDGTAPPLTEDLTYGCTELMTCHEEKGNGGIVASIKLYILKQEKG